MSNLSIFTEVKNNRGFLGIGVLVRKGSLVIEEEGILIDTRAELDTRVYRFQS